MTTLVVCCASWGLAQVAAKEALLEIPPGLQAGGRSAIAAVLVLLWGLLRGKRLTERDGTFLPGLAVGLIFGVEVVVLFQGVEHTTASRGIVIFYLAPFFVAGGGHFLLGERLDARKLAGLACAFAGVVLAFSDSIGGGMQATLVGDALCLVAAILWAA